MAYRPPTGSGMISRAGGVPQSRGGALGGSNRPPTGQGGVTPFRPPSAMAAGGSGAPGTGRLGTGRAPTSYGVERGVGVGLNAQLQVQDRPFTKEGMAGMRTATASRRVVHDRSYHLGQLRAKSSELQREASRLEEEMQQLSKDQQLYHQKQKKVSALKKEVADLRGKLSDYNLAVQLRLGNEDVNVQEVLAETDKLHIENQRRSRHVDMVFQEQSSISKEVANMEGEIARIEDDLNMQLEDDPEKKQYVDSMRADITQLRDQIMRLTQQKNDYHNKTKALQGEVSSDPVRAAAFQLTQEKVQLMQRKAELSGEVDPNSEGGSVEDERARLLRETREKKGEIEKMQRRLLEIDEALNGLRSQVEFGGDESDPDSKFVQLLASDGQITEEIDEFPDREQEKMRRIRALQEKITDHLTEVSTGLAMKSNLPSSKEFEGLKRELLFKQQKAMQASSTADRIQNKELNDLLRDLKSLENLESKIEMQRKYNEDKLEVMRSEMGKYQDLDGLKTEAESSMEAMREQERMFRERLDKISSRVSMAASELEADERRLASNDLHKSMQQLLKNAKFRETNVFTLEEFVNSEGAESNYLPVSERCMQKMHELNILIQKGLSGYV